MPYTTLKLSENTTGEVSSSNFAIRLAQSKFSVFLLLIVSLLAPIEAFSANCNLKTLPLCQDAVGDYCRTVMDPKGVPVLVCLSTAPNPPSGTLISTASCWKYNASYDCINPGTPVYTTTCDGIKNEKVNGVNTCVNYHEGTPVCSKDFPLYNGLCTVFDVPYTCELAPGNAYTDTTCSSPAACLDKDGQPTFCTGEYKQEENTAFGQIVAAQETTRQIGVYADKNGDKLNADTSVIRVFSGEPSRCSEGMWGMAPDCCKKNSMGANVSNIMLGQELVAQAWNNGINAMFGSEYVYDSLLDKSYQMIKAAWDAMQDVINGVYATTKVTAAASNIGSQIIDAGNTANNIASGANTISGGMQIAAGIGGLIGGMYAGAKMSQFASKHGANTGISGAMVAIATAAGTYAGAAAAGAIYGGVASVAATGSFTGIIGAMGSGAMSGMGAVCMPCVMAVLVMGILMSFAACSPEDMKTMMKLGAPGICHYVGRYCNNYDWFGGCITHMKRYCCFNSRLARIIQEGVKGGAVDKLGNPIPPLLPLTNWGTPKNADCNGFTVDEISTIDFSKIDLSEFIEDVAVRAIVDPVYVQDKLIPEVTADMQSFVSTNANDLTITDGQISVSMDNPLPPPVIPPLNTTPLSMPPDLMPDCGVKSITKLALLADGGETGRFEIDLCNNGAEIIWDNSSSNCPDKIPTSTAPNDPAFRKSTVDQFGHTSFTVTIPGSCLNNAGAVINNIWVGVVTIPNEGTIGTIIAEWH
jgi:hypothetical protein